MLCAGKHYIAKEAKDSAENPENHTVNKHVLK